MKAKPAGDERFPLRGAVVSAIGSIGNLQTCHPGLAFFKLVDAWSDSWRLESGAKQAFLDRIVTLNERLRNGQEGQALLASARCRLDRLVGSLSDQGWVVSRSAMRTLWRMVSGLGISHPLETGLVFHRTLGVPYLPGSAIKGAAHAWARQSEATSKSTPLLEDVFGKERSAGQVIFFDALPTMWPVLEIDIMNPHYGDYYRGATPPGDWLSPNPIHFLAVAPGQSFELIVAGRARPDARHDSRQLAESAMRAVIGAATDEGMGGKSAVGYGYFV